MYVEVLAMPIRNILGCPYVQKMDQHNLISTYGQGGGGFTFFGEPRHTPDNFMNDSRKNSF